MKKNIYYPLFDIIKFVLACILVLYHFELYTNAICPVLIDLVGGGFDAQILTQLFFEISGILIALSSSEHTIKNIKSAILKTKRVVIRFLPHCYFSIFLLSVLVFVFYRINGEWLLNCAYDIKDVLASILFSAQCGIFCHTSAINGVLWYIFALIRCYFVFYLIELVPRNIRCLLYIVFSVLGYTLFLGNVFPDFIPVLGGWSSKGFGAFFVGVLLYHIFHKIGSRIQIKLGIGLLLIYSILGLIIKSWDFIIFTDVFLFPGILCFSFFCGKTNNAIVLLGNVSFYIFIWHIPVLYAYAFFVHYAVLPPPTHRLYILYYLMIVLLLSFCVFRPIGNKIESFVIKHTG